VAGPNSVDEYMAALPDEARRGLEELRRTIKAVAPTATEGISYNMPVFRVNDAPIVWIAAYKNHYSIYPATEALERALGDELKPYLHGQGTIRFAADKPIPKRLVRRIVKVRLAEGSPYRR
jgi:uncharacterized protein YdhG (YjbR/CyaY superfamily)